MSLAAKLLSASGGGVDTPYVDDVFSAYTYTGKGSTQTINNGIDLAGKGGLVWTKSRSNAYVHCLYDTARGIANLLSTDAVGGQTSYPAHITSVNADGFSLGVNNVTNTSAVTFASWTFRKAPKFFDVVTYTGNSTNSRAIAHLLGQEVGMVMIKAISTTSNWDTYHRSATGDLVLNTSGTQTGSKALVNSATTSTFTVSGVANANGVTYVAYLFAHDSSADGIIQCGSFTTDASGNATVNLGWEPQHVMFKKTNGAGNWSIYDTSRAFTATDGTAKELSANATSVEYTYPSGTFKPTATGFVSTGFTEGSSTYVYLTIRRPNKPPTTGTQVYNAIARTGTGAAGTVTGVGFAPDAIWYGNRTVLHGSQVVDRLRGRGQTSRTVDSSVESTSLSTNDITAFNMDGFSLGIDSNTFFNNTSSNGIFWNLKRAPGVFDVVCDTGTGAAHTVSHGLGVVPELMIRKKRSATDPWYVYAGDATDYLVLNTTAATADLDAIWNDTAPTSSVFTVGTNDDVNQSAGTFVTYLFATKAGISKVNNYVGNGSNQTINCGFTTGARFILIKRTDAVGDWFIWDTVRGIIAGSDPHLSLNSTAAEVGSDDSIDPDTSGFIVNQLTATNINVNGAGYIYLAFA